MTPVLAKATLRVLVSKLEQGETIGLDWALLNASPDDRVAQAWEACEQPMKMYDVLFCLYGHDERGRIGKATGWEKMECGTCHYAVWLPADGGDRVYEVGSWHQAPRPHEPPCQPCCDAIRRVVPTITLEMVLALRNGDHRA